jgi:hypothetical protein
VRALLVLLVLLPPRGAARSNTLAEQQQQTAVAPHTQRGGAVRQLHTSRGCNSTQPSPQPAHLLPFFRELLARHDLVLLLWCARDAIIFFFCLLLVVATAAWRLCSGKLEGLRKHTGEKRGLQKKTVLTAGLPAQTCMRR